MLAVPRDGQSRVRQRVPYKREVLTSQFIAVSSELEWRLLGAVNT